MSDKSEKAKQLAQNIKSTCSKLKQETDKPYKRPGTGEQKIWTNLEDLKELLEQDNEKPGDHRGDYPPNCQ